MFTYYPTIFRHLLKEIFTYFIFTFIIFVFLFQIGKVFELTRLIVIHHISFSTIVKLLIYTLPFFLSYIIPVSALFSTLLTFCRFTQDKEFMALKASGISSKAFLPLLAGFAFFCLILTALATMLGIPWGSEAARDLTFSLTRQKAEVALKPGVFNSLPGVVLYVEKIENGQLQNIFLYSEKKAYQGETIIAQRGNILHQKNKVIFQFQNGCICKAPKKEKNLVTRFLTYQNYNYVLEIPSHLEKRKKHPKEYPPWELWKKIKTYKKEKKDPTSLILAFHKKISVPMGAFIFVFLGAVLGLREETKKSLGGISLGLILFTLYQALFIAGKNLAKAHVIPAHLSFWLPNLIFGGITIYLWCREIND